MRYLLLVGAQKAGSTYLHNLVEQDSKVAANPKKEPNYFAKPKFAGKDYHSMFAISGQTEVILDSSVAYLHIEGTAERIVNKLGDDVIIAAVLRDPRQRAVSAYLHNVKHGRELRSAREVFDFDAASIHDVRAEESERIEKAARRGLVHVDLTKDRYFDPAFSYRYFGNSLYSEQLQPYFKHFKAIIIVSFEELAKQPVSVANTIRMRAGLSDPVGYNLQVPSNRTKFDRWKALHRRRKIDARLSQLAAAQRLFTQRYAGHYLKKEAMDLFARFSSLADYQVLVSGPRPATPAGPASHHAHR